MRWITGFGLLLAYLLPLKRWAVGVQRWILERKAPRKAIDFGDYETPEDVWAEVKRTFAWRSDTQGRRFKFWDWPSLAEVFEHRRADIDQIGDGDCDDVAFWAATILEQITGVSDVLLLSIGYSNPTGGHAVVVYLYRGRWYVGNGKLGSTMLGDPNDAIAVTIGQMRKKTPKQVARWYVFETTNFKRVASSPRGRINA